MLMIEQRGLKCLVNKLTETDYTTIPVNYLEMSKLSGGFLGDEKMCSVDLCWAIPQRFQLSSHVSFIIGGPIDLFSQTGTQPHILSNGIPTNKLRLIEQPEQTSPYLDKPFSNYIRLAATGLFSSFPGKPPQRQTSILANNVPSYSLQVNNDLLVAYQQRWEREIASRFRESKKRFPEFFPCFELLECSGYGLQYSIHFEPLTGHAKALIEQTPLFPYQKNFKPIEKLWQDGSSELDIVFNRFPTQLALLPPKQSWGERMWELLLGVVHQGLELRHVGSLLTRKA